MLYLGEVIKVGRVVDGVDLYWDGGWPLPDVRPVDVALEVAQGADLAQVLHPLLVITAKSEIYQVMLLPAATAYAGHGQTENFCRCRCWTSS